MKIKNLVSIVIPTHNRKLMLARLLNGLLQNDYKRIEIIIINDVSTDGTLELLKKEYSRYKNIKVITNKKNLYTAGSRNKGATLAKGDYIFFIDDDNVVTKNLISSLVYVMNNDYSVGEVGPLMYYYKNKKKLFWARTQRNMITTKTNFLTNHSLLPDSLTWKTDDILNAFMVRALLVKKYKISFIENLGIMYEESDYAYKIKRAGFKILTVKNAIIYHDTEDYDDKPAAYLKHTLKDKKRIYFTARNRLVFHSLYSSTIQLIGIVLFWNWLFACFYIINIFRYSGLENYSFIKKVRFSILYFQGIGDGIRYCITKKI